MPALLFLPNIKCTPVMYKVSYNTYGVTTYINYVRRLMIDISYLHVYSYSPPGTGGYHASEGDTNVTIDSNAQDDKVVYAAPVQAVNIPHQAVASGEQYAVSTKAVSKTSEEQPPSGQYHDATHDTKKDTEKVSSLLDLEKSIKFISALLLALLSTTALQPCHEH